MEQTYWLGRTRQASAMARKAGSSRARLIHLDLAGRYSIMAAASAAAQRTAREPLQAALAVPAPTLDEPPYGGTAYYERLETGARWLAARAPADGERDEHLGMAVRYGRLRVDAARSGRR